MLTQTRLRELLDYNPLTGNFRWRVSRGPHKAGNIAGADRSNGYVYIMVDRVSCAAASLAWLYMTGSWPSSGEIDHKNNDPTDNRWVNLREANRSQQGVNTRLRTDNTSGSRGVCWDKKARKWMAYVNLHGKQFFCGYFDTIEAAKAARDAKAALLHGEFARFDNLSQGALQ